MKSFKIILLLTIFSFITACGAKVPFVKKEPLENASLVYIYLLNNVSSDDDIASTYYNIKINDKLVEGRLRSSEYMVFDLKPHTATFSVVREALENKSLTIDLKQGCVYYLRVKDALDNNEFELVQMSNEIGLEEIKKTGLSGSVSINEDEIITQKIDRVDTTQNSSSRLDKIKEAYKMKADGILTEDEYEKFKAEILAK